MTLFDAEPGQPAREYEQLIAVQDPPSGLRAIIVIHSRVRGPAFGGIRRWRYPSEAAGLDDGLRLARAMSLKCALAELPAGGAKTVVFDDPGLDAARAYGALGRAIEGLGGAYVCGPDVGTGTRELEKIRQQTSHVNPEGNDAGASTAAGVLAGLHAVCDRLHGDREFTGLSFVIQGLGAVGSAVAETLVRAGARVKAYDPAPGRREWAVEHGVGWVEVDQVLTTAADVFVPCALGGVIDDAVAQALPVRAVCGSANNVLTSDDVAETLADRGITFAPDIVVSAGAVIEGVLTVAARDEPDVRRRVDAAIAGIEKRTATLIARADIERCSPLRVALDSAQRQLHPV